MSTLLHQFFIFQRRKQFLVWVVVFRCHKGSKWKIWQPQVAVRPWEDVNVLFQPKCGQKTATSSLYRESRLSTVSFSIVPGFQTVQIVWIPGFNTVFLRFCWDILIFFNISQFISLLVIIAKVWVGIAKNYAIYTFNS